MAADVIYTRIHTRIVVSIIRGSRKEVGGAGSWETYHRLERRLWRSWWGRGLGKGAFWREWMLGFVLGRRWLPLRRQLCELSKNRELRLQYPVAVNRWVVLLAIELLMAFGWRGWRGTLLDTSGSPTGGNPFNSWQICLGGPKPLVSRSAIASDVWAHPNLIRTSLTCPPKFQLLPPTGNGDAPSPVSAGNTFKFLFLHHCRLVVHELLSTHFCKW